MSKLLKLMFNRVTIVVILLLVQISIIAYFINEASEYFVALNIVFIGIGLIYVIKLFKEKIPYSTIIPLIILLIFFPIIGVFLYYFSLENKMRKKLLKNIKNQTFTLESLYVEDNSIKEQLVMQSPEFYKQSQYIANNTYMPVYLNSGIKYYPIGEEFFASLIRDLKSAKHFIFLEFFIIGKGELWSEILQILESKVKEGVEVRVIFDDVGSLKVLPYKYDKVLKKLGIKCVVFNPISPVVTIAHNNRDHKKIAIIDGKIAYTGGVNIADEYINKKIRFGYWKDNGVRLTGAPAKSFTLMFLETWHYFKDSSEDCLKYLDINFENTNENKKGFVQPYCGDPFQESPVIRNIYLNIINSASDYLYIATPYFSVDQEFLSALYNAKARGVDVRIVVPHIPDKVTIFRITESYSKDLTSHGIKYYEFTPGFIHSKMIIADDHIASVGTPNFDFRSFYHNYECGVVLYNTEEINNIRNDFEGIFEKSLLVDDEFIKKNIGLARRIYGELLKVFSPLF